MENELIGNSTPGNNERVILTLSGINKEWVFIAGKGWSDKQNILQTKQHVELGDLSITSSKKSWQFWKK